MRLALVNISYLEWIDPGELVGSGLFTPPPQRRLAMDGNMKIEICNVNSRYNLKGPHSRQWKEQLSENSALTPTPSPQSSEGR